MEFDLTDDEVRQPEPVVGFEEDELAVRDQGETDGPVEDDYPDDQSRRIANADLDNAIDELVDLLNGRDLESLSDLLAPDAGADFVGAASREEVVVGLNDLFLRYPTLLTTRADLGSDPLIAVWTFDNEADRFDEFGYLMVEVSESHEGHIERLSYVDELADSEGLVVETPDRSDLSEWEDWSELDED